jgi:hypothetical protein
MIVSEHSGRDVFVLGSGPVGKKLGKALFAEGTRIAGFVDVDPKKIGGTVREGDARWPVLSMDELATMTPRPFSIAAVGLAGGRERVRAAMLHAGWRELEDFVVAA